MEQLLVPEKLPEQETIVEEVPEVVPEMDELAAITTLAHAFRRANRDSR